MTQNRLPALATPINFPLCMAPMVGLSHVALREVARSYMPAEARTIWPSEMLNSRRLPGEIFDRTPEVMKSRRPDGEDGWVPQILGNEEKHIAPSVQKLIDYGAVGVDINMGCPVQKALKHNYGVALMGDAKYAAEVVAITKRNSSVPVSVKLRAGPQNDFQYLLDFVGGLEVAGADWVCLHPRTAGQMRRGVADWEQIKELKKHLRIPLLGNGDIQIADDVFEMLERTGADMVMSGRALAARPWLLWQVGERLGFAPPAGRSGERAPATREEEGREYGRSLVQLLDLSLEYFGESLALRKFRFHVRTTQVWLLFGMALHSQVNSAKTVAETRECLLRFFETDHEMVPRTELRQ
jgi:tRNA-dihydrouridine synthase B